MRLSKILIMLVCICGLVCLFALAAPTVKASTEAKPVILKANAHSPPVALATQTACIVAEINRLHFDSAIIFARGLKSQPEVSPQLNTAISLHNKDEPAFVARE